MDHESISIDAESLCIHVIGNNRIAAEVLTNIRRQGLRSLIEYKSNGINARSDRSNFVFFIGDSLTNNKQDVEFLNSYLYSIKPTLILCFVNKSNSMIGSHAQNERTSRIPIKGFVYVTSSIEAIREVTPVYQTIIETIRAINSPVGINIDKEEFRNTLLGPLGLGHSQIWAFTSQATNPDRAIKALRILSKYPEYSKWLNQTDGLVIKITGGDDHLMGREVKGVMSELNQHISDLCKCVCSISHDGTLPKDGIKVTLLAARWA